MRLPLCAKCGKLVDSMTVHKELTISGVTDVYIAQCHGEKQKVRLSEVDIDTANSISFNIAFAEDRDDRYYPIAIDCVP